VAREVENQGIKFQGVKIFDKVLLLSKAKTAIAMKLSVMGGNQGCGKP
jgi:hypothetical protein